MDLQDGKLDGTYTIAQLQAFFGDPTVQGYCGPIATVSPGTPPANGPTTPPGGSTTPPTGAVAPALSGVRGTSKTVVAVKPVVKPVPGVHAAQHTARAPLASAGAPLAAVKARGTLPFTGAQLALFALVGLALIGTGLVLRSTARHPDRP